VGGLKGSLKKGNFKKYISNLDPDIICLQDTKLKDGKIVDRLNKIPYFTGLTMRYCNY